MGQDTDLLPIILDTDIGNDIDDAVALAYLLRQPRAELLGVTTVSGNTEHRAVIADAICRAAGREEIPIHAGLTGPLLHGRGQSEAPQYAVAEQMPHRTGFGTPSEAILFLRDTIRSRPGEITLLAIGPMTNLGALFAMDPEIPALLKQVVLMCGVFTGGMAHHGPGAREWNALIDPTATALTFRHAAPGSLLSVGLNVTQRCTVPAEECRALFTAHEEPLPAVLKLAEVWFSHSNLLTFHDPLAAALIFDPSLCEYESGEVSVWTNDDALSGMTRWNRQENGPHRIAVTVDSEHFFKHYFDVFAKT